MSSIKNVVKVMNFHALIRVDRAKRKAKRYQLMEKELLAMLDQIMNNRNLILDKSIMKPNPEKPPLTVYLGSDLGFCSNYNSQINAEIEKDREGDKILIGKKLSRNASNVLLRMEQKELDGRVREIEKLLYSSIMRRQHSQIRIVFVRYLNSTESVKDVETIFPMEIPRDADPASYRGDFMIDGDVEELMVNLLSTYLTYQIKIMETSGYASENILRQSTTSESLKKIEEREEEALKLERRLRRAQEFSKVTENFQRKIY